MKADEELTLQTQQMTDFARKASAEMGEIIFGAALREYRAHLLEIKQHTNPKSTFISIADSLMDLIEKSAESDDAKELFKAMTLLAAFQLMGWVDEEYNVIVEL